MASRTGIINIINVPSDIGSVYAGKSRAPAALKDVGLHSKLEQLGLKVQDSTAFEKSLGAWESSSRDPNGARNEFKTVEACKKVYHAVLNALQTDENAFQLILGGECLFCPAIMASYWRHLEKTKKRIGIIYVDADCDLHSPLDPDGSGNIAGMTLTHMTLRQGALEHMKVFSRPDGSGVVDNSNIFLFGLNVKSPANGRTHLGYLLDNNFRVFTSEAVQKEPIEKAKIALKWMEDNVDLILVHLDVDVIDPGEFPLCNVPNYTGLGFDETMTAVKIFLKSPKTVGLSLAEVNPDHDPGLKMSERLVNELVDGLNQRIENATK